MTQWAGIAALEEAGPDVARIRSIYDQRRCFLWRRLRQLGLGVHVESVGAFYTFANARYIPVDSLTFAFDIAEKVRLGVAPEHGFGSNAERFLRFFYTNSMLNMEEGMKRMKIYLNRLVC